MGFFLLDENINLFTPKLANWLQNLIERITTEGGNIFRNWKLVLSYLEATEEERSIASDFPYTTWGMVAQWLAKESAKLDGKQFDLDKERAEYFKGFYIFSDEEKGEIQQLPRDEVSRRLKQSMLNHSETRSAN